MLNTMTKSKFEKEEFIWPVGSETEFIMERKHEKLSLEKEAERSHLICTWKQKKQQEKERGCRPLLYTVGAILLLAGFYFLVVPSCPPKNAIK